jgi:RNA polymerase sigma-70 factor (ECF subfamily)
MGRTAGLEQKILEKVKRGDEKAAREIYDRYSKGMYNVLIRLVVDEDEAKDLLQESFIRAFQKIHSFRGDATFGAWLKRIVINTALESMRKKKIEFDELTESKYNIPLIENDEIRYDLTKVHQGIKQLPDGSRAVLTMYLLEGYSHKEIAEDLNISVSTSKTQYMRAKKLLQQHLKSMNNG